MRTEGFAPAKINLTLHVIGQRDDGYHLLESLVVFADVGDRVAFENASQMQLEVTGPFADGVPTDARNLVWQAAEAAGATGRLFLEKKLPHGAGIGGGSSDAAAMLRLLGGEAHAPVLGADVPVCLYARAAHMRGVGERVEPLKDSLSFFAVLANPGVHVATPEVFAALERKENPRMEPFPGETAGGMTWIKWLLSQRNDLEAPAIALAPEITVVLDRMRQTPDVLLVRMSGSGSTCFGLYPTRKAAHIAAQALQADHPDWWVVDTILS